MSWWLWFPWAGNAPTLGLCYPRRASALLFQRVCPELFGLGEVGWRHLSSFFLFWLELMDPLLKSLNIVGRRYLHSVVDFKIFQETDDRALLLFGHTSREPPSWNCSADVILPTLPGLLKADMSLKYSYISRASAHNSFSNFYLPLHFIDWLILVLLFCWSSSQL